MVYPIVPMHDEDWEIPVRYPRGEPGTRTINRCEQKRTAIISPENYTRAPVPGNGRRDHLSHMTNYIEQIIETDARLIVELSFKRVDQFFEPGDPSPVQSRDLTDDALYAMITAIIDREPKKPVHYIIRFPAPQVTDELESGLPDAVRTFVTYRCEGARRNLRVLLKRIQYGLLYGLSISAVLLITLLILYSNITDPILADIIVGAIIIFCWVALWDPIDIFLHQYLFQRGTIAVCTKRVINSTIRVEKADVQPDGMPSPAQGT